MRLGTPTSLDSVPSQNWGSSAPSWPICRPEEGLECSLGRSEIEHHSCHNPDSIPISTNVRNYLVPVLVERSPKLDSLGYKWCPLTQRDKSRKPDETPKTRRYHRTSWAESASM